MQIGLEAYHEIDGVRADLGGFPYSYGIVQNVIKDAEYNGIDKEQGIEEENQEGMPYISYAYDKNMHVFIFQIQVTELDFFLMLKYHSHVFIHINDIRYRLEYCDAEIEQVSDTIYICTLKCTDTESITIFTGQQL